ncbi:MAG: sensor histidine kinase [Cyclobacteriaceae bacterium]|nr:sensor histidine kinase [Cyclobacteriaceae bacterium]
MKIITTFFFILLWLCLSPLAAQNSLEDSLKRELDQKPPDSVKMVIYNQLRRATYYSNPEVSAAYTAKYLEFATIIQDSLQMAIANFYLGNANVVGGNFNLALDYYLKAAAYFESKDDEQSRLSSTYNGIASAYENFINDSLSLVYFQKSYEVSKSVNDKRRMGIAQVNMSTIYSRTGSMNETISLLEDAISNLQDSISAIYLLPAEIGLAGAYIDNNQPQLARPLLVRLINEIDSISDVLNYNSALAAYGKYHLKEGNPTDALNYLQKAYTNFNNQGFKLEKFKYMPYVIDAFYSNGLYLDAANLFYEYKEVSDSLFSVEKDRNLTFALQKYEAEKKDKVLLEQELEIQEKSKQNNQILFAIIILLLIFAGSILFFRKRLQYQKTISRQNDTLQKQKITELTQKNKLLALNSMLEGQEAERMRIAKDLHDSLGGLLSNVKAHFTIIQQEIEKLEEFKVAERTNQLIDEACLEVRRISHNMMPHALSIAGLKGALEDLAEYMRSIQYEVNLEVRNIPEDLEQTRQVTIYRLIQEILNNTHKHAEARSIMIQLIGHDHNLNLVIEDDGKGFEYEKAVEKGGLGLKSINSRVEFLDGNIEWDSLQGQGTSININIPMQ